MNLSGTVIPDIDQSASTICGTENFGKLENSGCTQIQNLIDFGVTLQYEKSDHPFYAAR
jgi:hypothetical protein